MFDTMILEILQQLPVWFLAIWATVFGAAVGSFLNVVIYRFPEGKSLVKPGSYCPDCGNPIKPWNNIPLVSYWLLRAKCPDCGSKIPARYFIVELLGAVVFVWPLLYFGIAWETLAAAVLGWHLIAISGIDIRTYTIPDHIVLPMGLAGLAFAFIIAGVDGLVDAGISLLIGVVFQLLIFIVSRLIIKREGIGSGDITMTAAFAVYLNPLIVAFALISAAAFGIIGSAILAMFRKEKIKGQDVIPFGPYLAIGAWVAYLYGNDLVGIYLHWVLSKL